MRHSALDQIGQKMTSNLVNNANVMNPPGRTVSGVDEQKR